MRYLITGAGGFIGGAVAEKLIHDGHECITIDNFSTGFSQRIPKQCQLIEGNTYNEDIISRLKSMPKFVYAGSMAVYGDTTDLPCTETTPAFPKSFYAVGKLASENYMRLFAQNFGLCCTSLRFFNAYGVGQNLDNLRQGMVSIFLAQALKNHHIDVKGSLQRFRDLVYIDDAVKPKLTGNICSLLSKILLNNRNNMI